LGHFFQAGGEALAGDQLAEVVDVDVTGHGELLLVVGQLRTGRCTSASMQRALPPPMRSMLSMFTTTGWVCRSTWRRCSGCSERQALRDITSSGWPCLSCTSSMLPAK